MTMIITKFGHSCLLIEEGKARILIDPGEWSKGFTDLTSLQAILITHEHHDHCDIAGIQTLLKNNPEMHVYTNKGVGKKLTEAGISFQLLEDGQSIEVQGLPVRAFGKNHAVVYPTYPHTDNTGYFIAERLFHPGDAIDTIPDQPVDILALPVVAPWGKSREMIDYALQVKPRVCIPIHDAITTVETFVKHPKNILIPAGVDVRVLEIGVSTEV